MSNTKLINYSLNYNYTQNIQYKLFYTYKVIIHTYTHYMSCLKYM